MVSSLPITLQESYALHSIRGKLAANVKTLDAEATMISDNYGMSISQTAAPIGVSLADPRTVDTDLVVLPVFEHESPGDRAWARATGGSVERAVASGEFKGKIFELFVTPAIDPTWQARRIGFLGAGPRASFSVDVARKMAAALGIAARQRHIERVALSMPDGLESLDMTQAVAEGLTLAQFDAGQYKTADDTPVRLTTLQILLREGGCSVPDGSRVAERGRLLAECSNLARGLANEPSNQLTPSLFAERAADIGRAAGLSVDVLDERQITELGMGLLLGVARGSHEPPRLVTLRHDPPGAPSAPVLGLVGKGITFDAGGISIKAADSMERMKDDMAGGAAVLCGMRALAALEAPVRVIGVIPATENMPGGGAIKPGDILKSASGKTVEVLNTDAEGRLILGDGLWYARRLGATHLVDVATLTGACVTALGKITSGLFGTPPEWVEIVRRVADRAGDRCWPMPVFDEYRDQLRSDIADMTNTGGTAAGAITAAVFLKEFTGGLPWVHMDIAGTAWADEARPYLPKGPSGAGVRTVAELAFTSAEWPAGV
jgi:leucyl aminopeptidase